MKNSFKFLRFIEATKRLEAFSLFRKSTSASITDSSAQVSGRGLRSWSKRWGPWWRKDYELWLQN